MDDYKFVAEISNADKDGVTLKKIYDELETQEEKGKLVNTKIEEAMQLFDQIDDEIEAIDKLILIIIEFVDLFTTENPYASSIFGTDDVFEFVTALALCENELIDTYMTMLLENLSSQTDQIFHIKIYETDLLQYLIDRVNNGDEGSRAHAIGAIYNMYQYFDEISSVIDIFNLIDFDKIIYETFSRDLKEHYHLIHLLSQYIPGIIEQHELDDEIWIKIVSLFNITFCEIDDINSSIQMNEFSIVLDVVLTRANFLLPMFLSDVEGMNLIQEIKNTYNDCVSHNYLRILHILSKHTSIMDGDARTIIFEDITFKYFLLFKHNSRNFAFYDALYDVVRSRPDLLRTKESFQLYLDLISTFDSIHYSSRRKCMKCITQMIKFGSFDFLFKVPDSFYELIISNIENNSSLTEVMIDLVLIILSKVKNECFFSDVKNKFLEMGIEEAVNQLFSDIDENSSIYHRCEHMMIILTDGTPFEEDN